MGWGFHPRVRRPAYYKRGYVSLQELALAFGIHDFTIRNLLYKKKLPREKVGRYTVFHARRIVPIMMKLGFHLKL